MSKICLTCGNELPSTARFCNICGTAMTVENAVEKDSPSAPPAPETVLCQNCGAQVPLDAKFCRTCGTAIISETTVEKEPPPPETVLCPSCGTQLPLDAKFCQTCGTPTASAVPKPQAESASILDDDVYERVESMVGGPKAYNHFEQHSDTHTNTSVTNTEAVKPSPAAETRTSINWKSIGGGLSTILTIILLVWMFTNHPISDTKGIVFDQWGTIELGDAVKRNFTNVEWRSSKVGNKQYLVTFSGFQPDLGVRISLTFDVNYAGDHVYAQPSSGTANGESFSDMVSIALVMGMIYG